MQEQIANGNCIIVIPFHPTNVNMVFNQLKIDRLYFWHKNTFDHPVNEETFNYFLFHAKLYGATVFPGCPELGCKAINVSASLEQGEMDVNQILYKGQIVYTKSIVVPPFKIYS